MLTGQKYDQAAEKALGFIERMFDPAEWEVRPYYGVPYDEAYAGKLMWGGAKEIPDDAERIDPQYIKPDQYYYPGYKGVMQGTFNLPEGENPQNFAVAIYRVSSSSRSIECLCPLLTKEKDDGSVEYTWSSGKLVEVWEYYQSSYDRRSQYMEDGSGGYRPWEKNPDGSSPTKYYRTEFSTSKVAYWYWAKTEVGSSSTYAYEIELVRKDWTVNVTDAMRQKYLNKPMPRPEYGYTRPDYLGMSTMEEYTLFDLIELESVHESYPGVWIGRDDKEMPTPDLPEFTTGMSTQIRSQSFGLEDPPEKHRGFIEYGYSRFVDYKIHLYALVLGDAEYLNGEAPLWSDIIYDLPENPAPIPPLVEEITDIVVMPGTSASWKNYTFLSTIDTPDGASLYIPGYATVTAENKGYSSQKNSHVTYKVSYTNPDEEFRYQLRAGDIATSRLPMAPRPADKNVYKFIAAGDPQITNTPSATAWADSLQKAFTMYPDANFIVTLGDNVDEQVDMALAEKQFSSYLAPPEMRTHPLVAAMGNHDDNMGFDGHFFPPYESSYGVVGGMGDYYFRYDDTLIMVINTNAKDARIDEHISFIEETVAKYVEGRGRAKWTIVMFHHSIFQPTNTAEEQQYVDLRNHFAPCFSSQGVDLVLMGHVHSYCRTHVLDCSNIGIGSTVTPAQIVPNSGGMEFTKTSSGQTVYITLNSASGSKYYPLSGSPWYIAHSNQELVPNISVVDVDNSRIRVITHRSGDMSIMDDFILRK